MQELLDWMEYIEDDRQQRKIRHTLKDILVIVLFATLANADDWVEMALFAENYQDYLRKYIELKNGIPSHDSMSAAILHEAGHLLAAISAGQKIDHIGITFWSIIPTGAYVSVDDKINSRKSEQMQFILAGIEVNLLFTGICLILIGRHYDWAYKLVDIAVINIILIIGNIVPIPGLDGEAALSILCGVSSIGKVAQKSLFDKKRRQRLLRTGWSGYVCFFIFCLVMFSRVIPLLLILLEWKIFCSVPS